MTDSSKPSLDSQDYALAPLAAEDDPFASGALSHPGDVALPKPDASQSEPHLSSDSESEASDLMSGSVSTEESESSDEVSSAKADPAPEAPSSSVSLPSGTFKQPGTLIDDRYELQEELGAGGMGRVYRALDRRFEPPRQVALKMQRSTMRKRPDAEMFAERFRAEASLPAALSHPNIVTILDIGCIDDDTDYYVMEYVEGARTIADEIDEADEEETFIALPRIISWFEQAAKALKRLHAVDNAWHRDIKPDNLLLFSVDGDDFLKLIDFGISHRGSAELTEDGTLMGTPSYMAPEYFEFTDDGSPLVLDHRSDLFALGLVLYKCLTNEHPYPELVAADQRQAIRIAMRAYQRRKLHPFLPSAHREDLPPGWDYVTMKLLQRDREQRYQSATEFLKDLHLVSELPGYSGTDIRPSEELSSSPSPAAGDPLLSGKGSTRVLPDNAAPEVAQSPAAEPVAPASVPALSPALVAFQASPPVPAPKPPTIPPALLSSPSVQVEKPISPNDEWVEANRPDDSAQRHSRTRLFLAGGLAVAILVLVAGGGWVLTSSFGSATEKKTDWSMPGEKVAKPKDWTAELDSKPLLRGSPSPALASSTPVEPDVPADDEAFKAQLAEAYGETPASRGAKVPRSKHGTRKPRAKPTAEPENDNEWTRLFGSGAVNTGTLTVRSTGAGGGSDDVEVKGMRLAARLMDNVASLPRRAPVVAQLTKKTVIGSRVIPAGSELHGETTGAQGARVFIDFHFIRMKGGSVLHIDAMARGRDGRSGVPGKKLVDAKTGGSVAVSGAGAAVSAAAGKLAEATGEAIGSQALQGAGDEAARKTDRFDHDERVVLAKSGTLFNVYVKSLPDKPNR